MAHNSAILFLLVVLPFVLSDQIPNQCRSLDNSKEVAWWAVITQPGGKTFLYTDSTKQAIVTGGGSTITGPFELHDNAPQRIEQLFINHINIGKTNNEKAFPNDDNPKVVKETDFQLRSTDGRSGFKTLQVWTNDQPAGKFPTNILLAPRQDPNYAWAHSKHLVSFSTQEPNNPGFMILHSFPRTPIDLYPVTPKGVPVIFKWVNSDYPQVKFNEISGQGDGSNADEGDGKTPGQTSFLYSQHAFCFNFGNGHEILKKLIHSYVRVVDFNANPQLLIHVPNAESSALYDLISTLIIGQSLKDLEKCEKYWKSSKGSYYEDIAGICTSFYELPIITSNNHEVQAKIISHAPTKDAANQKKHIPFKNLGPMPWARVATTIRSSLFLFNWKNSWLPSVNKHKTTPYGIYLVDEISVIRQGDPVTWLHGDMHEKIAISVTSGEDKEDTNNNNNNNNAESPDWVCFGDGNHRASEITHAGLAFCFQHQQLHNQLRAWIKSVNKKGYIPNTPNIQDMQQIKDLAQVARSEDDPTLSDELKLSKPRVENKEEKIPVVAQSSRILRTKPPVDFNILDSVGTTQESRKRKNSNINTHKEPAQKKLRTYGRTRSTSTLPDEKDDDNSSSEEVKKVKTTPTYMALYVSSNNNV